MSEIRNRTIQGLEVGDTFIITRKFTEQDMLNFADITRDYNPIHIVLEADLTGIVPAEAEKAVLSAMVAEGDPTNKIG